MNVTFNTTSLYSSNNNSYRRNNEGKGKIQIHTSSSPSFTGESRFLRPFHRWMNKVAGFIAKHYTKHIYESPVTRWLAKQGDKTGNIVDHMQTLGSVIISGMYMSQTLRNKDLDERRRKTLAINQGLTFFASTAIAYLFEKLFLGPWDRNVTLKYAKRFMNDPNLGEKYKKYVEEAKTSFESNASNAGKKFRAPSAANYIDKVIKNKTLSDKIHGLNVLKSLVIFGSVYRFIGPVAVTPIANWIGDKLFGSESKPVKKEVNISKSQVSVAESRPKINSLIK